MTDPYHDQLFRELPPLPPLPNTAASWASWRTPVIPPTTRQWWMGVPALTVPQMLSLRLQRPPSRVSVVGAPSLTAPEFAANSPGARRHGRAAGRLALQPYPLRTLPRLWRRTHRDWTARVNVDALRTHHRGRPLHKVWRLLAAWWNPADRLEGFFLRNLLPSRTRAEARQSVTRLRLDAVRMRLLTDVTWHERPLEAWGPPPAWYARSAHPMPPAHGPSLAHNLFALDTGLEYLATLVGDGTCVVESIAIDVAVGDDSMRTDAVLTRPDGTDVRVEVISTDYTAAKIEEKVAGLSAGVLYVGTSRTLAARALAVAPSLPSMLHP
jgi:hypothetical protein